ncbi:enkurin domain-containing protein 1-like [Haliotis asinina]|uniref:enkurin domain-containing protein 1-like n=1 Tax=Haliotis asinina TaxID=109174 RepID=UPI00353236A6
MQGMMMQVDGQRYGTSHYNRPGSRSKDHIQENVRRMRQIQRRSKQREQVSQQPVKVLWKSAKFSDVQSKIKDDIERPPSAPRPHSANYLRAHSRAGPPVKLESRPCTPDPEVSVPHAADAKNTKLIRRDIDFIKLNGRTVKHTKMQRAPSLTALDDLKKRDEDKLHNYQRGEVPKYLRNRQASWKQEEAERLANTPDPAMPPGHKMMPEAERTETLGLLRKKQDDLTRQLQALPLRNDTFRVRTCKQELENKIAEVEEAIKIFSRPKVFVKDE